jgi:hypothetical protein
MKPTSENRTAFTSSNESVSFGISEKDAAHVMGMLRDGLYTDKILAVLREYSANAWDAHRMGGGGDVPINVTIPTYDEPVLRIRDYGPGLSHDDVFNVYSQYGASTKRDTNDAVGCLGVGSKSGFAYSDMFTVTSWHPETYEDDFVGPRCGMKRTYVAVLDESEKGKIDLLDEQACDPYDTGVEIMIVVRREDVREFQTKAENLFQHFIPRPDINIVLPDEPDEQTILKNGTITGKSYYGSEWIAIMGCVPYRINLKQLDQSRISKCLPNLSGSLFFNIGEVQVSASREELKYSPATKEKIINKFNDLVDEYVVHALDELAKPNVSSWDKRLKVQVLTKLDLPLPEEYSELGMLHAKITYAPGTFVLMHNSSVCTRITVTSHTRILIDDTGNALTGYSLGHDDYVVRGSDGKTTDEVRTMLDDALAASGLSGATVGKLSDLHWNAPYVKPKKAVNPKHKARMFTFSADNTNYFRSPYSDHWQTVSRIAADTDVFVLISGFYPHNYDGFFEEYKADRALAKALGVTLPVVYGYKTSEKKPLDVSQVVGTEYRKWRETWFASLLTPDVMDKIQEFFWANPDGDSWRWPDQHDLNTLVAALGANHPIADMLSRQRAAKCDTAMGTMAARVGVTAESSDARKAWNHIMERYPLLNDRNFENLWCEWQNTPEHWVGYVKLVDERDALLAGQP